MSILARVFRAYLKYMSYAGKCEVDKYLLITRDIIKNR